MCSISGYQPATNLEVSMTKVVWTAGTDSDDDCLDNRCPMLFTRTTPFPSEGARSAGNRARKDTASLNGVSGR